MAYKSKFMQEMEQQGKLSAASGTSKYKSKFFQEGGHLEKEVAPAPMRTPTDRTFAGVKTTPAATKPVAERPTEQQNQISGEIAARTAGAGSRDPIGTAAHMTKISGLQVQEAELKLNQSKAKLDAARQKEMALTEQSKKLASAQQGLRQLMTQYEMSGDDVTGQAYLLAAEEYNKLLEQYQKDYAAYEKDASVYDEYNSNLLKYQKAYAGYEKNMQAYNTERAEYLQEHPEIVLQDASDREIQRTLDRLEGEKSGLILTGKAVDWDAVENVNRKIDAVKQLQQKKRLSADNGLWNSNPVDFIDRTLSAIQAGQTEWMAGMAQIEQKLSNAFLKIAGSQIAGMGMSMGNADIEVYGRKLMENSNQESADAVAARKASQDYMAEALTGTGKIDGWIIEKMQSVGSMMMDMMASGSTYAMGLPEGTDTRKIMAIRAGGSSMLQAQEEGKTETEQILMGIASGALEYASEGMFGGNPIYDTESGWVTKGLEKVIKNPKIMKLFYSNGFDILSEGIEEWFTAFVEPIAEGLITLEKPEMATTAELADAFAGGVFLSLMGQGSSVVVREVSGAGRAERQAGRVIQRSDAVQELVSEGLAAKPNTAAFKLATDLQAKLDAGKKLSAAEIGRQLFANQDAIDAGLLVDDEMQPDSEAPEGALQDPESGYYAIQTAEADGKQTYQLVEVREDGSIRKIGQPVDDLMAAKRAAQAQGMNIRHIGKEDVLRDVAQSTMDQVNAADIESTVTVNAADNENTGLRWAGNEEGAYDYGTEQRNMGAGADQERIGGNETGRPAESQNGGWAGDAVRRAEEARRIRAYAENAGLERRSLKELGFAQGSDGKNLRVLNRSAGQDVAEAYDMAQSAGLRLVPVSGNMYVQMGADESRVNGIIENGVIYAQADSTAMSIKEVVSHEIFHDRVKKDPGLVRRLVRYMFDNYSQQEISRRFQKYYDDYQEIYANRASDEDLNELIWEELLADAYAEYSRYGDVALEGLSEVVQEQAWAGNENENAAQELSRGVTENGSLAETTSAASGEIIDRSDETVNARFSLAAPVEQTKTLVAMHNMDEEKLRRTLKLGAWPSPSVAIVRAEQGHENYGEYSAIFPRSTIDPEADYRNKVYGSDAWTPTHSNAQVEYEVNYDAKRAFENMIEDLSGKFAGGAFWNSSVIGSAGVDNETSLSADEIAKRLSKYPAVQAAYLQDRGDTLEPVYKKKNFDSFGNEALQSYIDSVGYQELARLDMELTLGNELSVDDIEAARDVIIEDWVSRNEWRLKNKPELREKRIENQRKKLEDWRVKNFIQHAWEYYEEYGATTDEIDTSATGAAMFDMILPDGDWGEVEKVVQDWVRPKLEGILGEPGIYNGRDRITSNGRRSFAETHYPYSAENIVRAMFNQGSARGEGLWGANAEGMVSVATPEYESVAEIHADEKRLRTMDEDEYDTVMRRLDSEIGGFIAKSMEAMEAHSSNRYEEGDIIGYVLLQAAGSKTVKDVQRVFRREGYDLPTELAKDALKIFKQAAKTPTKYFEAKPQRVVGFEEALAIVAPTNAPADLVLDLQKHGVNVLTYQAGNENDRLSVINGIEGARFSVSSEDRARQKAERDLARSIGEIMSLPRKAVQQLQIGLVRDIMEEYQLTGELNTEKLEEAAANAFAQGLIIDNEYYEQYKHIRDQLRTTAVTISQQDQADIADYNQFRKRAFGTLRIVKQGGIPVDSLYQELMETTPELFPRTITHPADQLVHMYEVAREIRRVETPLERAMGEQSDQFYEWAEGKIAQTVERILTRYADSVTWKQQKAPTRKTAVLADDTPDTYDRANERMYRSGQERMSGYDPEYEEAAPDNYDPKAQEGMYNYGQQSYREMPKPGSGRLQEDYIQPEEGGVVWAGQSRVGNWRQELPEYQPDTYDPRTQERMERFGQEIIDDYEPMLEEPEVLTEEEQARRGTMREWIQYVLSDKLTPEQFAERMRSSAVGELKGGAAKLVGRMEETARQRQGDGVNLYRDPDMTDEQYEALNAAWKNRQQRKIEKLETAEQIIIPKEAFRSTPAMDKLGIKIDGSVTRYRSTSTLRGYEEAAKQANRMLDKVIRKLKPTEQEKDFAKMLVKGTLTLDMLNASKVDLNKIAEIADYYMAQQSFNDDLIHQRKAEINVGNTQIARELLEDKEEYTPKLKGQLAPLTKMVMNERAPERVVEQIFGQEQGQKIYEALFRPVWVNGAEMYRFENRLLKQVETFTDKDGKKRKLTEKEREFAQRLMENKAVADEMQKLQESDRSKIEKAARELNENVNLTEVTTKYGLHEGYEQGLAQAYADYLYTVEVTADMDMTILENAIAVYRQIYNDMYEAYNDFLVSHGHPEIGFIKDYAPHFQKAEVRSGLTAALQALGVVNEKVSDLPVDIAGRTADFKPNSKWNPHAQQRLGSKTDYDIQAGFERYIHYAAEVFYHTDDVMRIRAASNWLRSQYSQENISEAIQEAQTDRYKSPEWKQNFLRRIGKLDPLKDFTPREINEAYEKYVDSLYKAAAEGQMTKYSEFVTWLDNYANIVAGKQSLADRGLEYGGGRTALNFGNKLMRAFSTANVAGNISSVLNQNAQLPLLQQQLGTYLERAIVATARGTIQKDGFSDRSDFLTDKRGVEKLTTDNMEKFISGLFKPAEMMDRLVSTLAVRGRYLQALDQNMTPDEALKAADDFGRRIMGSRMKGARPLGFESKTFVNQMLHVFQTEAINTLDYMLVSDIPQAVKEVHRTKGKAAAGRYVAATIVGYLINAFLLNSLKDELYGGSPAPFDLIGWALNFLAGGWDVDDEEYLKTVIDNGWEKLFGERLFNTERIDKEEGFQWAGAVSDVWYDVLGDVPYLRNALGIAGIGDQSLPTVGINEVFGGIWGAGKTLWDQAAKGPEETGLDWAGAAAEAAESLGNAIAQIAPGGRQISKSYQGIRAMLQGGKYSGRGENARLQYPVDQNAWNVIRAGLFGLTALDETDDFYAGGKALTAAQTQKAKQLEETGVDVEQIYDLYQEFSEINDDLNKERIGTIEAKQLKRDWINNMDLTDEQKLEVYMQTMATGSDKAKENTRAKYEALLEKGVKWSQITSLENDYASFNEDADGDGEADMDSLERGIAKRNTIAALDLTDEQKLEVFDRYHLDRESKNYKATLDEFSAMLDAGLSWNDVTAAHNTYATLNADEEMNATQKATEYAKWADEQGWTNAQKSAVKDRYMFWQMIPAEATSYEKFTGAGLNSDNADKVTKLLADLEPEAGKDSVSTVQKLEAIANGGFASTDEAKAMRSVMTEEQAAEFDDLMDAGLTPKQYAQYRRAVYGLESDKDADGKTISGSKKKKVLEAINRLPISDALKTELYYAEGYPENTLDDAPWY